MNAITNNVISKITKLEKAIKQSKTELESYEKMIKHLKEYAFKKYKREFTISHVTINYLRGKIKSQESKRDMLKQCLVGKDM